jgi:hypothetical protein
MTAKKNKLPLRGAPLKRFDQTFSKVCRRRHVLLLFWRKENRAVTPGLGVRPCDPENSFFAMF